MLNLAFDRGRRGELSPPWTLKREPVSPFERLRGERANSRNSASARFALS